MRNIQISNATHFCTWLPDRQSNIGVLALIGYGSVEGNGIS